MNDTRRKRLQDCVLPLISEARCHLEEVGADEAEAVDNLPDAIRESERGWRMQEIVYALDDAVTALESLEDSLQKCTE